MSISKCYSAHLHGLTLQVITVEVDISNGLNHVSIVGLGDRAVGESKDRVSAAIKNSGFTSPKQKNQKVVISLAPANVRKEGPSFDIAIAIAYLCATGDISCDTTGILFVGELSLEGNIRKVSGILPIACQAHEHGFKTIYVPIDNAREASLASGMHIYAVSSLRQLIDHLSGRIVVDPITSLDVSSEQPAYPHDVDMSMIRGNNSIKRTLEIAAAGMHNVSMYGPPGTGKTMLAQGFRTILPPLTREESIEVTGIYSAARSLGSDIIRIPPFRAPHHTASHAAIIGGGDSFPRPGEITFAHRGVLFLDEFTEFDRGVLESLRQPLEARFITLSRAKGSITFPAECILLAAMNPCPCGMRLVGGCICSQSTLRSYDQKISGPIMDRIDIWLNVENIDYEKLSTRTHTAESSALIRERVVRARKRQADRFARHGISKRCNSEMNPDDISRLVIMSTEARKLLRKIGETYKLSARAFHRVIKVAQTIADLREEQFIKSARILEALRYRHAHTWAITGSPTTGTAPDHPLDSEHLAPQSGREVPS
ncbi:MAG TPA: YifB family Mg chelatase-like AAA ATPase [Candidatus Paceibacterota bacterium]